jgi:quercetin dioxygenase-like cupin family protein
MGGGSAAHYLETGQTTAGAFGLYRWEMGARPSGPSPHFHRSITESFYVLSGAVRLHDGRRWRDAGPGDFLHVPAGGVHGFRYESGEPASMLLLFTPGAPREDYFETLADAARREAMGEDDWTDFYLRHDTFWVEPGQ